MSEASRADVAEPIKPSRADTPSAARSAEHFICGSEVRLAKGLRRTSDISVSLKLLFEKESES